MKNNIKFAFYTIFHPADGFWVMKREGRGSLLLCFAFILLNFITIVIQEYCVGFLFDTSVGQTADILFMAAVAVAPVFLFSLANLAITTFLEGDGKFIDIFMMTCYSLLPAIMIRTVITVLTNVMSLEEGTYISLLSAILTFWVVLLLFVGIMETHNYTMSRTIASAILTIVSMVIIIFLLLLFLDMVSRIFGFGYSIFQELQTRT